VEGRDAALLRCALEVEGRDAALLPERGCAGRALWLVPALGRAPDCRALA
jgi:hypothetical protein